MRRKRKHIPCLQLLAAALVELLPPEQQVALRAARGAARGVVRMFTPDHIVLHALDGPDAWWNLHMRLRGPTVLAKNARDTSVVAKVKRVSAAHQEFIRRLLKPKHRRRRRRGSIQSRPFPKRRPQ